MDKNNKHIFLFLTPAICWGILICYFSLMPENEVPGMLKSIADYFLHFGIYAFLSLLIFLGLNRYSRNSIPKNQLIQSILFSFFLGLALELIQEFLIPGRHFQVSDVVSNTMGILVIWPMNYFLRNSKMRVEAQK